MPSQMTLPGSASLWLTTRRGSRASVASIASKIGASPADHAGKPGRARCAAYCVRASARGSRSSMPVRSSACSARSCSTSEAIASCRWAGVAKHRGQGHARDALVDDRPRALVDVEDRRRDPALGGTAQHEQLLRPGRCVGCIGLNLQHELTPRAGHRVHAGAGRASRLRVDREHGADTLLGQKGREGSELGEQGRHGRFLPSARSHVLALDRAGSRRASARPAT